MYVWVFIQCLELERERDSAYIYMCKYVCILCACVYKGRAWGVYMHLSRTQLAKFIGSIYYIECNCGYVPISTQYILLWKIAKH